MNRSVIEPGELRQRAEARMAQAEMASKVEMHPLRMLHELQVHEIELQLQNEALIAANRDLDVLRKHYEILYERAPVGYLTLSLDGVVRGANPRAFEMLKRDKATLVGSALRDCFAPESVKAFTELVSSSTHDGDDVFGENLLVQRPHNVPIFIKAQCRKVDFGEIQERVVLLAIMDVSALKFAMDDVLSRLQT